MKRVFSSLLPQPPPPFSLPSFGFSSWGGLCVREGSEGWATVSGCASTLCPLKTLLNSCLCFSTIEPTTPLKTKEATKKKKKQFGKKRKWLSKAAWAGVGPGIRWARVRESRAGELSVV